MDFKNILNAPEYDFLRTDEHLGKQVILLGMAGSYSYGTNVEASDIDVRGIALNRKSDLLGLTSFEQYVDANTDTTVYSLNKIIPLLLNCNPSTIELLGLKPEHYLYMTETGRKLIENRRMFLSQKVIHTFGGYADAQLRRLQNALARDTYPQREKEQHMLNSIKNSMEHFRQKYTYFDNGQIRLYLDVTQREDFDAEIYMDVNLQHYPLRDYRNIWSEMNNIIKDYEKVGKRNKKKDNAHLNKHSMHLIRLLITAIDILENGDIVTCRQREHDLLMSIRRGDFQNPDGSYRREFYDMLAEYEKRLVTAAVGTALPEKPDVKKVEEFLIEANEKVVRDLVF